MILTLHPSFTRPCDLVLRVLDRVQKWMRDSPVVEDNFFQVALQVARALSLNVDRSPDISAIKQVKVSMATVALARNYAEYQPPDRLIFINMEWHARMIDCELDLSDIKAGKVVMDKEPIEQELRRHELLLSFKILHELQHAFTYEFISMMPIGEQDSPERSTRDITDFGTPDEIGTIITSEGVRRGDSGFALEERLLNGGRMQHRCLRAFAGCPRLFHVQRVAVINGQVERHFTDEWIRSCFLQDDFNPCLESVWTQMLTPFDALPSEGALYYNTGRDQRRRRTAIIDSQDTELFQPLEAPEVFSNPAVLQTDEGVAEKGDVDTELAFCHGIPSGPGRRT